MKVISISEGRKILGKLTNVVKYQRKVIALGKHGQPEALLVALPGVDADFSLTEVNAASPSFAFLEDEPELYSPDDLKERYV